MPRRTKAEAAQTRQSILGAALEVFYRKGFARTTMEDIARQAGFTRGAVYWHFKDKIQLFTELYESFQEETETRLWETLYNREAGWDELKAALLAYLAQFENNAGFRKLYEIVNNKTEYLEELAALLQADRAEMREIAGRLETWIRRQRKLKRIDGEVDPKQAALSLAAGFTGLIDIWILDQGHFSLQEQGAALLDLFYRAIRQV